MSTKDEVAVFLRDFKVKLGVWGVIYRDERFKNTQTLLTLDIVPAARTKILEELEVTDYCEGPIEEKLYGGSMMWVFGKAVKGLEVYIKITMGIASNKVLCISFHVSEHAMNYPLKSEL